MLDAARRAWNRYWFTDGALSCAVARMVVALAVIVGRRSFIVDFPSYAATHGAAGYRPIGLLRLLGTAPPDPQLLAALSVVGGVAACLMLIGLATRLATALSFVCHLLLVSYVYSFAQHWSHGLVIVFLAHACLLFGRTGAVLSVDAVIRQRRGLERAPSPRWPVLLAQASVALMFVNACYWKLEQDGFGLGWALSDNLRNILTTRYFLVGGEMPSFVTTIVSHEWLYKGLALGNLLSQGVPIAAVVFADKPWIRVLGGAAFLSEAIGLDLVMGLPNPHWIPLAALFVDWDRVHARLRGLPRARPLAGQPSWVRVAASCFIVGYSGYALATAFGQLDRTHKNYPFSSFPLYRDILAFEPYENHQPYPVCNPEFRAIGADGRSTESKSLQSTHSTAYWATDPAVLESYLASALVLTDTATVEGGLKALELRRTIYEIPAYPAPPTPTIVGSGLLARTSTSAAFTTVLAAPAGRNCFAIRTAGIPDSALAWSYMVNRRPPVRPLEGTRRGSTFCVTGAPVSELLLIADATIPGRPTERYYPGLMRFR